MKKIFKKISIASLAFLSLVSGINAQVTYNYTGNVQTYTVPMGISSLIITAAGAQGGGEGAGGGMGAIMSGEYAVTPGEVLTIVVGQQGQLQIGGQVQNSSGGGGGTFVYNASNTLLVAAGGGGGKCNYTGSVALHPDAHGKTGTSGGASSDGNSGGTAGSAGNEGLWSGSPCAGGGAGWLSVSGGPYGGFNAPTWAGGNPFCGGGGGGCGGYGGYGGGGGGGNHYGGGGGGGGYSGGGGGTDPTHGGGGGSYSIGINQNNTAGANTGNGYVEISNACTPGNDLTAPVADLTSLPDLTDACSIEMLTAPTATDNCAGTLLGTTTVSLPITASTTITWTYDDGNGNTSTQTQNVVITGLVITSSMVNDTIITADQVGDAYQWIDCDNGNQAIPGETNQTFEVNDNGNYAVIVTIGNCSATSNCIMIDYMSVGSLDELSDISIYPNPVNDYLTIETENSSISNVMILDMTGKKLKTISDYQSGSMINVNDLNMGSYLVVVETASTKRVLKFNKL